MSGLIACPNCGYQNSADRTLCEHCSAALQSPSSAESGHYLGRMISQRYRVVERIARGGMGEVYIAEHAETRQLVAVKFLHKRYAGDASFAARFFNEARYASQVTHPNAVATYDFGRLEDGTLFLVMEYVRGQSLRRVVRAQGIIPVHMAVRIISQAAEVLASAHEKKIIHRDVKPDNIMLVQGAGGRVSVKVLDFGIAKILDDESGNHTEPGVMFGTPEYMSPEQALGKEYDHRVDIYALGLVLYYMLAGHPPFRSKNKMAVLQQQAKVRPVAIQSVSKQPLPKALVELIDAMLSKSPDNRPATMVEVLEKLDVVLADPALDADILSSESIPVAPLPKAKEPTPHTVASGPEHVAPPREAGRVRRGEDYEPIAPHGDDPSLKPVQKSQEGPYHFTPTETRIPPLSLGKKSDADVVRTERRERLWMFVALIALCTVLVLVSLRWILPPGNQDDDLAADTDSSEEDLAVKDSGTDEDRDASAPEDAASVDNARAKDDANQDDRSAKSKDTSADAAPQGSRHAEQMTRAKTALKDGDLATMRDALSAIPTTDPPEGFKDLRTQLLRAEKLTADLRDALENKQCENAEKAANSLRSEFQEKLASPYRDRIQSCAAQAQKDAPKETKPAADPTPQKPANEAPAAAATPPKQADPPTEDKPTPKPADPPKEAKPAAKPADPPKADKPSSAPSALPDEPAKPADPPKDDKDDDVLPPMEL